MSRWSFVCAAVAALLVSVSAGAATIVRVADEDLVEQAPLIVVGRLVAKGPAASGAAATDFRFEVEEVLHGTVGPELTVRVPGGMRADGVGLRIFGAPTFALGERSILFLEPRAGGEHRVLHLMQGAFREVRRDGGSFAVRDLADVVELRRVKGAIESAPAEAAEPVRDFDAFARWVGERSRGGRPAADYRVAVPAAEGGTGRVAAPFSLFDDPFDGIAMRWFAFDGGGQVQWRFGVGGQPGVPGGAQAQFQAALNAWNADSQTPIRYVYAGTSAATGGLACDDCFDELNVILFGDPNGELDNLVGCSGTLAYGGPWYTAGTGTFRGVKYHEILEADIVINDGLDCFFNGSDNAAKAAEELFAHELGHTLGIDHACGNSGGPDASCQNAVFSDALMAAFIHDDGRGARLNSDDLAAARALYRQGGGSGPASPPAAPSELVAAPLSTTEIELSWQDNSSNETGFVIEAASLGGSFVPVGTLEAGETVAEVFGLEPATGYRFQVRARNAQGDSAASNEVQASTDAVAAPCVPGAQTLCLAGGLFRVEVDWVTEQSTAGEGQVVPGVSSDDSGLFYFFQESNWEMLVKVLAACPVNGHNWVFYAATTNVGFTVTVTDTGTVTAGGGNPVGSYFNPAGNTAQTITDTNAFSTCP